MLVPVGGLWPAARIARRLKAKEHRVVRQDLSQFWGFGAHRQGHGRAHWRNRVGDPGHLSPRAQHHPAVACARLGRSARGPGHFHRHECRVDYSGYPECRPEYLVAFEAMAKLATKAAVEGRSFEVRGLLVDLLRAAIMKLALELGVEPSETVSCYQPDAEGRACGACDACRIRKKGFADADMYDSTPYQ